MDGVPVLQRRYLLELVSAKSHYLVATFSNQVELEGSQGAKETFAVRLLQMQPQKNTIPRGQKVETYVSTGWDFYLLVPW